MGATEKNKGNLVNHWTFHTSIWFSRNFFSASTRDCEVVKLLPSLSREGKLVPDNWRGKNARGGICPKVMLPNCEYGDCPTEPCSSPELALGGPRCVWGCEGYPGDLKVYRHSLGSEFNNCVNLVLLFQLHNFF